MTEEEYWEEEETFETLFLLCSCYCEESLAKRLGRDPEKRLPREDYKEARKVLEENWQEIEDEICEEHWEEENERFPWGIVDKEDFRSYVKDGMETCLCDLVSYSK